MDKGTKMLVLAGVCVAGYMYYKKTEEDKLSEDQDNQDQDDVEDVEQRVSEDVLGCMDTGADNYDATATKDDGSCVTAPPLTCVPAMDSEGGGVGKYISVDGPNTPKNIETARRLKINNLNVGETIQFDGRPLVIKKFWVDASGVKGAIQVENHEAEIGSHGYTANSKICF
jgi:hypothetical protein|tara:strand:- start:26 stop:538 length:513 start_codon:yes stop_codon:yes gene_type:complete